MRTILHYRIQNGDLVLWQPKLAGDPCARTLLITEEINGEFDENTWLDRSLAHRYANLDADFDRFVTGKTIPVGMEPYDKDESAFMARIDPHEYGIWTIRSVAPSPAIRVFGAFCEVDIFIALSTRLRRDLGGPKSTEWAQARENAIANWNKLFPGQARLTGENVHDFISEKTVLV